MHEPRTDEQLIEVLRAGDMRAFDLLYDRYERRLFGYVLRMVGERERAEDLFQDIFLGVLRDRSYDPRRGRFSAWLFTVARNRCLGERRKQARRAAALEKREPLVPTRTAGDESVERDRRVRAAMAELPEGQRQLLLLKQVGELTYREIANILGVAEGTIKSRLHAATRALRHELQLRGEGS